MFTSPRPVRAKPAVVTRDADEFAGRLGLALGHRKNIRQGALGASHRRVGQRLDQPVPRGLVRGSRDLGRAGGEEFLLLQLDPLPRRVAEHHIEPAPAHHIGEFQRPVEGARRAGGIDRGAEHRAEWLHAAQPLPDHARGRHHLGPATGHSVRPGILPARQLGQQEGRDIKIAGGFKLPCSGAPCGQRLPAFRLGRYLVQRVLGHVAQGGEFAHQVALAIEAEALRDAVALGPFTLVLLRIVAGDCFVVTGQRLVGGIGDAVPSTIHNEARTARSRHPDRVNIMFFMRMPSLLRQYALVARATLPWSPHVQWRPGCR